MFLGQYIASVRYLEFKNSNFDQIISNLVHISFHTPNLVIFGSFFIEICRHNLFHISGRPPSWTCDDVIILHPVIDFHGPNIFLYFVMIGLAVFIQTSHMGDWQTDRQMDRQTHRRISSSLKASFTFGGAGLNDVAPAICCSRHTVIDICSECAINQTNYTAAQL